MKVYLRTKKVVMNAPFVTISAPWGALVLPRPTNTNRTAQKQCEHECMLATRAQHTGFGSRKRPVDRDGYAMSD